MEKEDLIKKLLIENERVYLMTKEYLESQLPPTEAIKKINKIKS